MPHSEIVDCNMTWRCLTRPPLFAGQFLHCSNSYRPRRSTSVEVESEVPMLQQMLTVRPSCSDFVLGMRPCFRPVPCCCVEHLKATHGSSSRKYLSHFSPASRGTKSAQALQGQHILQKG